MAVIYFILILGLTVFIHELGHFIFAKKAKVHVYEFALGFGPRLFKFKRKNDETIYSIRLLPLGGFVSLAGEENDSNKDIKDSKKIYNKTGWQRFSIFIAGVLFNFILSIILLFFTGLFTGAETGKIYINEVDPSYSDKLQTNDLILKINGHDIKSSESLSLYTGISKTEEIEITLKRDSDIYNIPVSKIEFDGKQVYPFSITIEVTKNFFASLKYAFTKFYELFIQMILIIWYLITGKLSLTTLSGPVGIYTIINEASGYGFDYIIYLLAIININIGFINLLPIPVFDGGQILSLIIEKIRGKRLSPKINSIISITTFVLLMILMVLVTYNDIIKLIK